MRPLAFLVAGAALGAAAWVGTGLQAPMSTAVLNLLVGWAFFVAGALLWRPEVARRIPLLLGATGVAWFAGDVVPALVFLHRGPLIHLLLAYPSGRLNGSVSRATVVSAYGLAVAGPFGAPTIGWTIVAAAVMLVTVTELALRRGTARHSRLLPALASVALGAVLLGGTAARLLGLGVDGTAALVAYDAVLAGTALLLAARVLSRRPTGMVTQLVVDLGDSDRAGTLRERLARAVGDPGLIVAFCVGETCDELADERGAPVRLPAADAGLVVTPMVVRGRKTGVLVHDPAVLRDARSVQLVSGLAELVTTNSSLQREIRQSAEATAASRTRLVRAGAAQRRRIESVIRSGPADRLDVAARRLRHAAAREPAAAELRRAADDLVAARDELLAFARGVYPAILREQGLADALIDLGRRSGCRVDALRDLPRHDPNVEATLYFVAAEAIANAAKHAAAGDVAIAIERERDEVVLRVVDDGVGGASLRDGGGLRGLADRVEAFSGRLLVRSVAGSGTTIEARVSLEDAWPGYRNAAGLVA